MSTYQESSFSVDDGELADDDLDDLDDRDDDDDDSTSAVANTNEDTEEASETDMNEPREIKEEMFQDKLESLRIQINQLISYSHPDFLKRLKRIDKEYLERVTLNQASYDYMMERVEQDYIIEKKAAAKEFEEKKVELKENLVADLEDKKRQIEGERFNVELNGDSMEVKPALTRKLRRRPNDPPPLPDKRRKPLTTNVVYTLDERDIEIDLKLISKGRPSTLGHSRKHHRTPSSSPADTGSTPPVRKVTSSYCEARVEDGKLLYEKRWYHRGQSIFVEGRDYPRFPAHITAIGSDCIWVKKTTPEGNKLRIFTSLLARGKIIIKRRAP